jgi:23S rRNA (pseudouridine1915-N3)-methyltransferase
LPERGNTVVLDERGKSCSSVEFAKRIARWREEGDDVSFVIGGADGVARTLRERAHWLWSLSPLTLPHGLVRILLAEQIYRAASILGNHPYHRE